MNLANIRLRCIRCLVFFLVACAVFQASLGMWSIELRRTACLGLCPDYTLRVWSTGFVQYHGNFALTNGDRVAYIGPFQAQLLLGRLLASGFLFFEDNYSKGNVDFEGSSTCLTTNWFQKCVNITFDIHPLPSPPPGLLALNRSIDEVTNSVQWIGTLEQLIDKHLHPQHP